MWTYRVKRLGEKVLFSMKIELGFFNFQNKTTCWKMNDEK